MNKHSITLKTLIFRYFISCWGETLQFCAHSPPRFPLPPIYIFRSESSLAVVNFTITSDRWCDGGASRNAPPFSPDDGIGSVVVGGLEISSREDTEPRRL